MIAKIYGVIKGQSDFKKTKKEILTVGQTEKHSVSSAAALSKHDIMSPSQSSEYPGSYSGSKSSLGCCVSR